MAANTAPAMDCTGSQNPTTVGPVAAPRVKLAAWQVCVLAIHATAVLVVSATHEPWFDEAQAWLLARDATVTELLTRYPRYEGSPPIWHLLLKIPAAVGAPYRTMSVISALVTIGGAHLVLTRSKFPVAIRIGIIFSYWGFYQYGVVARNYSLLPPLLFLLAANWTRRSERPAVVFGLLGLIALVSAHGALIASALMARHVLSLLPHWLAMSPSQRKPHVVGTVAFAALLGLLVFQLRTPPDQNFVGADQLTTDGTVIARSIEDMLVGGFTQHLPTTTGVLAVTAVWLAARRCLLLWLLPTVAVTAFAALTYGNVWHEGIPVLIWFFALWVSFEPLHTSRAFPTTVAARGAVVAAVAVVLLVHLRWTFLSIRYDHSSSYSAASTVAAHLKAIGLAEQRVHTRSIEAMSIQPYFAKNIWSNYNRGENPSFWWWSSNADFVPTPELLVAGRPAAIVYGDKQGGKPEPLPAPELVGYRVSCWFRGALWLKDQVYEQDGYYVLTPADAQEGVPC